MNCPKCNARFSLAFAFKIWNPRKFNCPHCGCTLRTTNITPLLVMSGVLGFFIAAFAIGMEQFGLWSQRFSPVFLAVAAPLLAFAWALYLWRRNKVKLASWEN